MQTLISLYGNIFRSHAQALFFFAALFLVSTPLWVELPREREVCEYSFSDFSVEEYYGGAPAPVDFSSHPPARRFETRMREGAAAGPNFAGRYSVIEWGCGTSCSVGAIVDARTGEIAEYGLVSSFGFGYELGSRLLVVNPPEQKPAPPTALNRHATTTYFEMRDGALQKLCEQ